MGAGVDFADRHSGARPNGGNRLPDDVGFADAADYYARASVGPRLGRLRVPALEVAAEPDPMVPPRAIRPALERAGATSRFEMRWVRRGGHVAFPRSVDLGLGSAGGLAEQLLGWLDQRARGAA